MSPTLMQPPVRYWKCPSCGKTDSTQSAEFHVQFHNCPALGGIGVPLTEVQDPDAEMRSRHVVVQSVYGPEIAAVRTEHMDGSNDCNVYPPPAYSDITTTN